ncbi:trypsin-like peptidase domain-containing protein [Amycolatopsis sp. CA-230715]|uniref:trypsin-like peptidase domain-containing protein n=1 Tax=Amycolatopsis sp. CA-230715 TaxID=2745196 RepID=UPI001C034A6B|nr:trypsin-like peptidase domain-containing protein [Amycolatopsis sp. CA-230715]QWF82788.1 hypothetical protein HUW46_06227 [Amycolatopsis sp. CA-230715]
MASDDRHGPVRERVAELLVATPDGGRRGSGYRITDRLVLTAAHVVAGAASIIVRFEADLAGEWSVEAEPHWCDADADLALLTIEPCAGEAAIDPAPIGIVGGTAEALPVCAVGFPLWKLRPGEGPFRDSHQMLGTVAPLSNWREGTLEVTASAGGPPGSSAAVRRGVFAAPWEGMSGAAVWSGKHIIGVIASHYPDDGSGRLAAARIDPLPPIPGEPSPRERAGSSPSPVMSAYREQLKDIAPIELVGRKRELGELYWFCQGDEPYAWWEAGPWTGKTALLSTFALQTHPDLDVVSFFITRRFAGQSDSEAYTEAMIEQLAAVAGEPVSPTGAKHGYLLHLLRKAADRCVRSGRVLVLVVDGLDEDTGHGTMPSIASLLPKDPPPGVHIVVASRPNPPLPDDVPDNHPLWTVQRRALRTSEFVQRVERQARQELSRWIVNPGLQRDVFGLITASGGGLTRKDLLELTGQLPVRLTVLLGGSMGRSLDSRSQWESVIDRPPEDAFLFAHETLKEIAEEQLGPEVAKYREQLHEWADGYRERRWPRDTPVYLLRGYRRLLTETRDLDRLYECAIDRARHDRMLDLTGGDALALSEVTAAIELHAAAEHPDLTRLIIIAVQRADLYRRSGNFPPAVLGLWARLGQVSRARTLAAGIVDPEDLVAALSHIAAAAAHRGDDSLAKEVLEQALTARLDIMHTDDQVESLLKTTLLLAEVNRVDIAVLAIDELKEIANRSSSEQVASFMAGCWGRAFDPYSVGMSALIRNDRHGTLADFTSTDLSLLPGMAAAATVAGDLDRARAIAVKASEFSGREHVSALIACELAAAGEPCQAAQMLSEIVDSGDRFDVLLSVADSWVRSGNRTRAWECWHEAAVIADHLGYLDQFRLRVVEAELCAGTNSQMLAHGTLVAQFRKRFGADFAAKMDLWCRSLVARMTEGNRAGAWAQAAEIKANAWIDGPGLVIDALVLLGRAWAIAGDDSAAAEVAVTVERQIRGDVSWRKDSRIRSELALGLLEGGDVDRGLSAAVHFNAFTDAVVDYLLWNGKWNRILQSAGQIDNLEERLNLLQQVAEFAILEDKLDLLADVCELAAVKADDDDRSFGSMLVADIMTIMSGCEVESNRILSSAQFRRKRGLKSRASCYFENTGLPTETDYLQTEAELVEHLVTVPSPLLGTAGQINLPALQRAFDFLISRE